MRITYFQWILIGFVRIPIFVINFVESLYDLPERTFVGFFRGSIIAFIAVSFSTGYFIDTKYDLRFSDLIAVKSIGTNLEMGTVLGANEVQPPIEPPGPVFKQITQAPVITASSIYAVDLKSGDVLFEKNSELQLAPASTTKLMTALVALEIYDLNEQVVMPAVCTKLEAQTAGIAPEEKISVDDLVHSLLIASSADAACALSNSKLDYDVFIQKMNENAKSYEMNSTKYDNAIGLDSFKNEHYSSAKDLYILAKNAIQNDFIKNSVNQTKYDFKTGAIERTVYNTNILLTSLPGTVGIKTGTTVAAKEVFIYEYSQDEKDIIIVVMGSKNRFEDTKSILNWILNNYSWGAGVASFTHDEAIAG